MGNPAISKLNFVAVMEYVLDVYKKPYNEDKPLVCMDESPKQLIREIQSSIPMKHGQPAGEYVRTVF